ncbi:MAG: hypothetical protein K0S53_3397 [Bacteroidetes bacterium]|jgi:hypothetical protein|nr:hypothetical protein [Bacteroidota bacterium]
MRIHSYLSLNPNKPKPTFKKFLPAIISLTLVIAAIWSEHYRSYFLTKNGIVTVGKITKISKGYRSSRIFHYEFKTKDQKIITNEDGRALLENDIFINRTFLVIYNPYDPEHNDILMQETDFQKYYFPYPDSLRWVKEYEHW